MKQVTYAGTSFITGTAIADSLLSLVAALGASSDSASVHVPALDTDDEVGSVDLVIGPASEVVAVAFKTDVPELIDEAAVDSLDQQTRALSRPQAVASSHDMDRIWSLPDLDVS
ncbi:hypothetical protein GCM10027413_11440 [Conyzicola nivalis]|uniref:Uncharacterized protein n=1 Tax=Conyzicola nivalis TaxID=1477021 RepID=A0A916WIW7_9MICO|nr:hypothetical protein [Conyzicola nivalis]GGB01578.1 hypothetical protein GCM10010979_15190 [Conyzicola nivalis]